jgi:hypothetical protein
VFTNCRHKFFPKKVISEHPVPCPEFGRGWCEKSVTHNKWSTGSSQRSVKREFPLI